MKKRKILVLFPFLGLLLSGCTLQEALGNVKDWTTGHILDPIKNLINGGEKEEQPSGDEGGEDQPTEVTIRRIRVESCPTEVAVNYVYKTSEVSIKVFYSDGTEEVVEPETVRCDTSTPGESTLYVTYKGFESDYPVRVLSEEEVVHVETITVETRYVNDMRVGDTYTINVSVLPSDATNKAVTFTSENEELATVTSEGVVTAVGAGVVKVNVASVDNPEVTNWVQFTIAEVAAGLPEATKAGYTKLAATETLKNGEKVNFAGAIGEKFYAMPNYTSGNNIKAKEVSTEDGKLVIEDITEEATTFTHEFTAIDNGDGTYSFMQANGKYLSAAGGSSSNYLKVVDSINDTAKFKVAVDANGNTTLVAEKVARGSLCLNPNSGTPIFACYAELKYEAYALYHDGKGSTDHVAVEGIAFEKSEYSMEEGGTLELSVNVLPALATDKEYSLTIQSAEPEGCITLSGNTVTAVAQGTAVILAKSHENEEIKATATITVTEHIERNYGSLENPLSITEAKAVIDLDGGKAAQTMYVTGKVTKNDAYNSSYKNTNVWITDGVNEFELYGALMPEGFEPAQPAKDDPALVGKIVVAHGNGKLYNTTYELDKNCQIDSVENDSVIITGLIPDSATGIPETIEQGKSLDRTEINVGVYMSDGSEGVTHPDSIVLDTENLGPATGKLIIGEFEYEFSIEVIEKVERNYGTLENPLTVSEALALITETCPNSDDVTEEQIYCEGEVSVKGTEKSYGYQNVKVSDGQSEVLIYSLNMTTEQKAQFDVGTVIKFHGYAKNFKGTLEFATNGSNYVTVDVLTVPEVAVTGISLDQNELNMEVGMPDQTLVATVLPENATNKAIEWVSANPEVATVNDGVVHAVAAGETTVTVTSVADPTKSATCSVTVSEQTKELVSVQIKTMPKVEYTEGETLDLSDLVLTLYYSDQSTQDVTTGYTTNIALDHELTTDDTELIITYGEFGLQPITLTISEKVAPQPIVQPGTYWIQHGEYFMSTEKGTNGQPLATNDSSKALQLDFVLEEGTTDQYKIKVHDGSDYLYVINNNNGVRLGSTAAVWTVKSGLEGKPGAWTLSAKDTSNAERFLTMYNTTDFRSYTSESTNRNFNTDLITPVVKTLESISIEGPTKVDYEVGQQLNTEGLVVTAHYLVGEEIEDRVLASNEYTLSQQGAFVEDDIGDKTIVVSFGEKTAEFIVHITAASEVPPTEETRIEFTMGENGSAAHADGSSATTYSETVQGYTLSITDGVKMYSGARDAAGNSCLKFGTSSVGGSFNLDLSGVTGVKKIIILAAQYKANSDCAITVGSNAAITLTSKSNDGAYDEIEYEVGSSTSVSVSFSKRAMMNGIIFVF